MWEDQSNEGRMGQKEEFGVKIILNLSSMGLRRCGTTKLPQLKHYELEVPS